ncbi:hypothetical protein AGLY_006456 [Aphis glycines]|uniref:Uncharacterized protein n=1 Tax=Aphis glycines TaxID=307491 RepID=A0A6G0TRA7_APHGL|nr:hypothetical protein AGLY_006456 [Aphis glycines]
MNDDGKRRGIHLIVMLYRYIGIQNLKYTFKVDSESSDECIDFTIIRVNNMIRCVMGIEFEYYINLKPETFAVHRRSFIFLKTFFNIALEMELFHLYAFNHFNGRQKSQLGRKRILRSWLNLISAVNRRYYCVRDLGIRNLFYYLDTSMISIWWIIIQVFLKKWESELNSVKREEKTRSFDNIPTRTPKLLINKNLYLVNDSRIIAAALRRTL